MNRRPYRQRKYPSWRIIFDPEFQAVILILFFARIIILIATVMAKN